MDDANLLGFRVKRTWFARAHHGVCQSGARTLSFTYHSTEGARIPGSQTKSTISERESRLYKGHRRVVWNKEWVPGGEGLER